MYDQRQDGKPGGKRALHDAVVGTPGKSTLTQQLSDSESGAPMFSGNEQWEDLEHRAADPPMSSPVTEHHEHHKHHKKGTWERVLDKFHKTLKEEATKLLDKVADKITGAPERALERLLKKLEDTANDEIQHGLKAGDKSCLNQASINDVEAAINTTRLIAAFHLVHDLDKAVLAELATIHSHEQTLKKAVHLFEHLNDALDTLTKFGRAMDTANAHYHRLLKQAAQCRPVARINPALKPMIVPHYKALPGSIELPPDIEHPSPPIHIVVPGILTE